MLDPRLRGDDTSGTGSGACARMTHWGLSTRAGDYGALGLNTGVSEYTTLDMDTGAGGGNGRERTTTVTILRIHSFAVVSDGYVSMGHLKYSSAVSR